MHNNVQVLGYYSLFSEHGLLMMGREKGNPDSLSYQFCCFSYDGGNGCINPWSDTFILLFRSDSSVEIIFGIWSLFSWLSGRATLIFIFVIHTRKYNTLALQCSIDVHVMCLPKSTRLIFTMLNFVCPTQLQRIFNISMFNLYFSTVWWLRDLWIISTTPPGKIFINNF